MTKTSRAPDGIRAATAVDRVFRVSILLKGASGLFESLGGLLLLLVRPEALSDAAQFLTARELGRDPHDYLATSLLDVTNNLTTSTTLFAAVYLLGHGIVKLFLVWAVLKERLWAFPLMMALLLGFIGYQGYELTVAFSWGLALLTAFDVFVLWLTIVEYRKRRQDRDARLLAGAPAASSEGESHVRSRQKSTHHRPSVVSLEPRRRRGRAALGRIERR